MSHHDHISLDESHSVIENNNSVINSHNNNNNNNKKYSISGRRLCAYLLFTLVIAIFFSGMITYSAYTSLSSSISTVHDLATLGNGDAVTSSGFGSACPHNTSMYFAQADVFVPIQCFANKANTLWWSRLPASKPSKTYTLPYTNTETGLYYVTFYTPFETSNFTGTGRILTVNVIVNNVVVASGSNNENDLRLQAYIKMNAGDVANVVISTTGTFLFGADSLQMRVSFVFAGKILH